MILLNQDKSLKTALKRCYLDLHILVNGDLDWIHYGFGTVGIGREYLGKTLKVKTAVTPCVSSFCATLFRYIF